MTADPVTVTRHYNDASRSPRWLTRTLLAALVIGWYFYSRSVHMLWFWWLLYTGAAAFVLVTVYVVSHTSLTYSPTFLAKRLAGRERRLDLTQLKTAGVQVVNGRYGHASPATGLYPVAALYLEDCRGTRMTLSVVHPYPNASQWANCVRVALESSDATIGDRVMSTLEGLASAT
jgi:hypothetical protein